MLPAGEALARICSAASRVSQALSLQETSIVGTPDDSSYGCERSPADPSYRVCPWLSAEAELQATTSDDDGRCQAMRSRPWGIVGSALSQIS